MERGIGVKKKHTRKLKSVSDKAALLQANDERSQQGSPERARKRKGVG